jgi:cyclic pyranopterin phosphate synthase
MTADGRLRPCLFSEVEVPVGDLLRKNEADEEIIAALREAVRIKPAGNQFRNQPFNIHDQNSSGHDDVPSKVVMRSLGG